MAKINEWLEEENLLIAHLSDMVENSIASFMDQVISDFGQTGQFAFPTHEATSQLVDILGAGWNDAVSMGTARQAELLTKQSGLTVRAVAEYVRTYGLSRTRQITGTTVTQLNKLILRGQRSGLSNIEIARNIVNSIPQIAKTRARIIAETEIHSAAQFGSYNAALRAGVSLKKIWNTVEDDRVRDFGSGSQFSHRMMQGSKSALDIPFKVPHYTGTFEQIRFPGDPEGSAGNIINCRCIMTYEEA